MTKLQFTVVGSAILLFFVLYFGCNTIPEKQKALEKSRALAAESTDIKSLLKAAKAELSSDATNAVLALESQLRETLNDTAKVSIQERISGLWFELGYPAISGYFAQDIAEIINTEDSWSIAGTTYTICVQRAQEEKVKSFCSGRAVQAFENAISINPQNTAHKVNLALCYAENPPQDNPMKGILMLIDLNKAEPNNVMVLNNLAQLAIKTGQFDRAVERLTTALSVESENIKSNCLIAQAYDKLGDQNKAATFAEKCSALSEQRSNNQ